ncbi:MAG: hypothetical protein AB7F86_13795 [Bdellovibrionales bacterium]
MKKRMILAALAAMVSASAWACDEVQAVREYYDGPEIREMKVTQVSEKLYSISYFDLDGPAKCEGGLAAVSDKCEVEPVRALFCSF